MAEFAVIGAGPAGISAAVYAARAGLSVRVFYRGIGALEKATVLENYYGFSTPIRGEELFENGLTQARRLGVALIREEVVSLEWDGAFFSVQSAVQDYRADAVLLACGAARHKPKIAGLFQGR